MGFTNVVRLAVQFVSVPILARFLSPEDYGLAAMAMPVILFLMTLADAGLAASLVRSGPPDGPAWHTCFWLSGLFGTAAGLAVALVAPGAASLLGQPRLTAILLTLAAVLPLQSLTLVPGAALQQGGRFGVIATTEITAMGSGVAVAVVLANSGCGVWALVWQQVVFYTVRLVFTLARSSYRPKAIFDLHDARDHLTFGRNLLGAALISFVSRSLENLVIGRVWGTGVVGVYAMAFQFARLPSMLVTGPLQYVLYPHVAAIRGNEREWKVLFLFLTRLLAAGCLPAVALAAAASGPIFTGLLSEKWSPVAPIFVLVAPATAVQPVTALIGTFLMATGRTDVQFRLAARYAALWLAGLLLAVGHGVEAVAAAYTACVLFFTLWSLRISLPVIGCSLLVYARCFLWPGTLTAAALLVYHFAAPAAWWADITLATGLAIVAGGLALALQRRALRDVIGLTLRAIKPSSLDRA